MPRPIEEKDKKRLVGLFDQRSHKINFKYHKNIGIYVRMQVYEYEYWAYRLYNTGEPMWVEKSTIDKRKRIGHPKKRKPIQRMKDISPFSMEEMELAAKIMKELK